jgi:hypothetical protein
MRFRKRIKICKGLSINLSKSGASLTFGGKGASVNIGKKGAYLNTNIPGTGLYNRQKIGGQPKKKVQSIKGLSTKENRKITYRITISLDEAGKPIIKNEQGNIITDINLIRQFKRQDNYKEIVRKLIISRREQINKANCTFIEIYKQTPTIKEMKSYEAQLNELKCEEYILEEFSKEEPSLERIKIELQSQSNNPIKKILFWKKDNESNKDPELIYKRELSKWQEEKKVFNDKEQEQREIEDNKNREAYNQRRNELMKILTNTETHIAKKIESFLGDLVLPVEFAIDYQYYENSNMLCVDLDLPEIEAIPKKKASLLSNGNLSIKSKNQKELKEDYARCVTGLAFYFAGNLFNMSPKINDIVISGYTQRLSKRTGRIEDEYVYSIRFDRDTFKGLQIRLIDPIEAIKNFNHRMNIASTYDLMVIEPLGINNN